MSISLDDARTALKALVTENREAFLSCGVRITLSLKYPKVINIEFSGSPLVNIFNSHREQRRAIDDPSKHAQRQRLLCAVIRIALASDPKRSREYSFRLNECGKGEVTLSSYNMAHEGIVRLLYKNLQILQRGDPKSICSITPLDRLRYLFLSKYAYRRENCFTLRGLGLIVFLALLTAGVALAIILPAL